MITKNDNAIFVREKFSNLMELLLKIILRRYINPLLLPLNILKEWKETGS